MIDFVLNAVAKTYSDTADKEISLAVAATERGDYANTAVHICNAIRLTEYRDHEILGQPYNDGFENDQHSV